MSQVHRSRSVKGCRNHSSGPDVAKDLARELGPAVLDACHSLWCEFTELSLVDPRSFGDAEQELLRWYAEVRFQLGGGGGRCDQCRAHVRHPLPMRIEIGDRARDYPCLCTRCIVAFEHQADRIWYTVGDRFIEHPIRCGRTHQKAA